MIYNTNQQVAQYLVEFSVKGDTKNPLQVDISLKEEEVEETDTEDNSKIFYLFIDHEIYSGSCRGHDCMVVGFTTICAISAYHH